MEHKNETAQARALRLLEAIYDRTVTTGHPVHASKLAVTIGSTEPEALAAWRYLKDRGLIKTFNVSGAASVNANGIDTIENARKHPTQTPPGFGSVTYNTITIHHMEGGAVQQAGAQSTQQQLITYSSQDFDDLRRIVEIFTQHIDELTLDAAAKRTALAQVDTLKAQLSDKPNPTIIREAGHTLRHITEGAIAGLITQPGIWQFVHHVLMRMF